MFCAGNQTYGGQPFPCLKVWGDGRDIGDYPQFIQWRFASAAPPAASHVRISNVGAFGFLDSWKSKDNVWLWGDGVDIGQRPENITWSVVAVLECPGFVQIKHLPTGRMLYSSPDDWVRVVDTAHEPRRSHWILKNHLEGHAQLAPGVYYVINLGSGRFLDGALTIYRLNAFTHV